MRHRTHALVTLALLLALLGVPAAFADDAPTSTTTTTAIPATTTTAPGSTTTTTFDDSEGSEPNPAPTQTPPNPVKRIEVQRKLTFPVVGQTYFHPSFGACRDNCSREHHGNDIMSWYWKGLPVVAATDGTVTEIKVETEGANPGCGVVITDPYGWQTRYYHLNTDLPGTDEPGMPCPVPGLQVGSTVVAGQIIGYQGDSGNAEHTPAHLHFELRTPSGFPVDPYPSLKKAERIYYEVLPPDFAAATLMISEHVKARDTAATIVVTSDEADRLMSSEDRSMVLDSPLVTVDPENLAPALAEIERLDSTAITILSDMDVRWLQDLLRDYAPIVERLPMPTFEPDPLEFIPDSLEVPVPTVDIADSFSTIIAGATDRIYKSRQLPFIEYAADHRVLVIDSEFWGPRNIGHRSWGSPGRYADRTKVWWGTGDGWIATEPGDPAPEFGYAYLAERRVNNSTLAFLGSLAETERVPIWRSR